MHIPLWCVTCSVGKPPLKSLVVALHSGPIDFTITEGYYCIITIDE